MNEKIYIKKIATGELYCYKESLANIHLHKKDEAGNPIYRVVSGPAPELSFKIDLLGD